MDRSADIAIVGGGIVGLAHAYMALKKGLKVVLFERDHYAVGASVRNFGLLWPIGQPPGEGLDRALRSLQHWKEICKSAGIWMNENGSLHLAYHDDEMDVLNEFMSLYNDCGYNCGMVSPEQIGGISPVVKQDGLKGGLVSITEATVYSREAIKRFPVWLTEAFGLILRFGQVVKEIDLPLVKTSRETWRVGKVLVCSGSDFEALYPEVYHQQHLKKCRLQMMKAVPDRPMTLGPSLCAGLTLTHYAAFADCPSLQRVIERYDAESEQYRENGIHVLLAQNVYGEFVIGDSHHYGDTVEPFDKEYVNEIILRYLSTFTKLNDLRITERWHGVYAKSPENKILIVEAAPGVTIVNGFGGAGMTLSFGVAEDVILQL